ncbi:MAG: hypothetical protein HKN44_08635 [Ilumatobacter sp.]|nr:hypothetical protein [Ilumatobacter sp.]
MPEGTFLLQPAIGLLILFGSVGLAEQAPAPAGPTVAVEIGATEAVPGETVTASVHIRNGTNIAGADVAVETDDCLRIVSQTPGDYLPTSGGGGFVVFDETTDNSSRLAVAITDRSALANADGIFFEVEMDVLCDYGDPPIRVSFAELSAYVDPAADPVELIAYRQEEGADTTTDADVTLVAVGGALAQAAPDGDEVPRQTAGNDQGAESEPPAGTRGNLMVMAGGVVVVALLVIVVVFRRRRSARS